MGKVSVNNLKNAVFYFVFLNKLTAAQQLCYQYQTCLTYIKVYCDARKCYGNTKNVCTKMTWQQAFSKASKFL